MRRKLGVSSQQARAASAEMYGSFIICFLTFNDSRFHLAPKSASLGAASEATGKSEPNLRAQIGLTGYR
jgi:hypothetical protein